MRLTFPDVVFWTAVVLCVVAQAAILRSVLFASHIPPPSSPSAVPPARRGLEIVWAVIPAVVLAMLLALTWREIHPASERRTPAPRLGAALSPTTTPPGSDGIASGGAAA